jgi:hypothetical protein
MLHTGAVSQDSWEISLLLNMRVPARLTDPLSPVRLKSVVLGTNEGRSRLEGSL